jgi:16S rRNA C1402 (ribose-2'-O) methylase RsmI
MGKELSRKRTPPTITTVNGRSYVSSGRWNDIAIADYILANGRNRAIEVKELAKVGWGHITVDTKNKARRYLHKVKALLIDRGVLVVTELGKHNEAITVKVYDPSVPADRQHAFTWIERMRARGELSAERYERAKGLLGEDVIL